MGKCSHTFGLHYTVNVLASLHLTEATVYDSDYMILTSCASFYTLFKM